MQATEIRSSVKYQLKKVLCLGVAVGNVNMAERELYINIQVRRWLVRCSSVRGGWGPERVWQRGDMHECLSVSSKKAVE